MHRAIIRRIVVVESMNPFYIDKNAISLYVLGLRSTATASASFKINVFFFFFFFLSRVVQRGGSIYITETGGAVPPSASFNIHSIENWSIVDIEGIKRNKLSLNLALISTNSPWQCRSSRVIGSTEHMSH